MEGYKELKPGGIYSLNQNPKGRAAASDPEKMHTLVHVVGMLRPDEKTSLVYWTRDAFIAGCTRLQMFAALYAVLAQRR